MKRPRFPHAKSYTDRTGKTRWRYRPKNARGFSREIGTASFYRSPEWRGVGESTKKTYRGVIEAFRAEHGGKRVSHLKACHVRSILDKKADTPAAANNLRKRLSQLMDHAVRLDWITANPVKATKSYKVGGNGFHAWDEGEIARFFEVHGPGTLAHRAVTLMLYTGAARVDAVKLGPWNLRETPNGLRIEYRRQKTMKTNGMAVSIPVHPDLAAVLADLPSDRPFLATAYGKARSAEGLGNSVREWCDAAGLTACTSHGLRKACARRLAEAGANVKQIAAVTGHKTLAEVQRYTETADRQLLADQGFELLLARPNGEQTVVNFPDRFTKKSGKQLKTKEK